MKKPGKSQLPLNKVILLVNNVLQLYHYKWSNGDSECLSEGMYCPVSLNLLKVLKMALESNKYDLILPV